MPLRRAGGDCTLDVAVSARLASAERYASRNCASRARAPGDVIDAAYALIAGLAGREGAAVIGDAATAVAICSGRAASRSRRCGDCPRRHRLRPRDASVCTLGRARRVDIHGMALAPGDTAAFGFVGARACCCCPDDWMPRWRWLVIGRRFIAAFRPRRSRSAVSGTGAQDIVGCRHDRSGAGPPARRSSRWPPDIFLCTRWRRRTGGSWFRPKAKVSRPAPRSS